MPDTDAEKGGASVSIHLPPGTRLGGMYEVVSRISQGGFGITYAAEDNLHRSVVVKECYPGGIAHRLADGSVGTATGEAGEIFAKIKARFLAEARLIATLNHPGIVHVQTLWEENNTAYMAMDRVNGSDLSVEIARSGRSGLSAERIASLLPPLLDALEYLHAQDVLHRDIKPNNIIVTPDGRPVLIDFGASRQQAKEDSSVASSIRIVADGFSPPEFYIASAPRGPASDLFSLAATLYNAITGAPPRDVIERTQAKSVDLTDPVAPLLGSYPEHDQALLALIDDAMTLRLVDRPADVAAWRARLGPMADTDGSDAKDGLDPPPPVADDVAEEDASERSGNAVANEGRLEPLGSGGAPVTRPYEPDPPAPPRPAPKPIPGPPPRRTPPSNRPESKRSQKSVAALLFGAYAVVLLGVLLLTPLGANMGLIGLVLLLIVGGATALWVSRR